MNTPRRTTSPLRHRLALVLWASLAGSACEAIGAPLVDELPPPGPGIGAIHCGMPPACRPIELIAAWVPPHGDALPIEDALCPADRGTRAAPVGGSGAGDREEDAGVELDEGAEGDAAALPLRDSLPDDLTCESLSLAATDRPALMLEGAEWSYGNVRIAAASPLLVALRAPQLHSMYIDLRGPVTLRLEGGSATDLRVVGQSTGNQGRPSLVLSEMDLTATRLGASGRAFAGTASIEESRLEGAVLHVDDATIVSSTVVETSLDLARLLVSDTGFASVSIHAETALMSSFKLARSRMEHCGATLVAGIVVDSELRSCEGATLQVYGGQLLSSLVDGLVVTDAASLGGVRLGVESASTLHAFGSSVTGLRICEHVERFVIDERTNVGCTACDDHVVGSERICRLPGDMPRIDSNFCQSLDSDEPLPECSDPIPERTRMFEGVF